MKLETLSPEILAAFKEDDRKVRINNSIGGCWLAITLMPAGFTLDYFVYPAHLWFFLKLRVICSLLVGLVLLLFYTPIGKRHYLFLGQIWYLLPAFFISWMIYASDGAVSSYYAGLNIVLVAVGLMLPWTYLENLLGGVLVMAMYLGACFLQGPLSLKGDFFNNLYFLVLTDIIVVTGSYFQGQLRFREYVLRYELDKNKRMLEESNQKLIDLDQMKSQFFANISHELRTPLTLIISPLETLRSGKGHLLDDESREVLKLMESNAMRLLKLINDLLDLVKMESGKMETKASPLALGDFMRGLIQSVQGAAKDKRVLLSADISPDLGVLLLDRDKLEKIFLNLVFNAIKFTPSGGKVELRARPEGDWVVFEVRDTGMGISEKNIPFIFDRFWQGDSSARRKYQGTGIGLALVKELVEVQNGTVGVESREGQGTVMTVKIPLVLPGEGEKVPEEGGAAGEKASEEWLTKLYRRAELFPAMTPVKESMRPLDVFSSGRKPKVLVVDDEPDMLKFLKSQLTLHYEVLEAVDGNQAVEKARQFIPDLVVMDMMMPEKDGVEACREIKALAITRSIPVILLTARADDETKIASLKAGASDFLTKPFSSTELHVRVKNLVDSHRFQMELAREKSALESTLEQLKETEGQLIQSEKMASLGRLSAGIIHEINNPLNYAVTALHVLKGKKEILPEAEREKYGEIVFDIEEGVQRVQRIVSDLRTFSHPHSKGTDLINLAEVVEMSRRFLSQDLRDKKLEVEVPEGQLVLADHHKLVQVFVNLIQNASDALKGRLDGVISVKSGLEDGMVWVRVRDNGPGIAPENLSKIFDPFFTTKDVGEGMGLGLSVCFRIIKEQGGSISAQSEPGKFTEFTLRLQAKAS